MIHIESEFAAPKKARVEIIPLIDVIFFLLATFVLFTLTLHRVRVFDPDLPQGGLEEGPRDSIALIQASGDGTFYWKEGDGTAEAITAVQLGPKLEDYKRRVA